MEKMVFLRGGCALLLVVQALAVSSCSNAPTDRAVSEVRDSAGIRIVTNAAPSADAPWSIDLEPSVEIGGVEEDTTQILFRVAGAVVLTDGRIVVAQGPAPMLRWFDADGTYQFGAGRPGGGPGEFGPGEGAWISALWVLPGDSVASWEHPARRMQVFDPAGRYVRAVVLDIPPNMPVRSYPQVIGRLDHGFVAFLIPPFEPGTVGEVTRDSISYIRFRSDGRYAGEIARVPGFTSFTRILQLPDGRQTTTQGRPPFAKLPVATPTADQLIYGSSDRYELAAFDTTGAVKTLIRKPIPSQPLTPDDIETYKRETMAAAPADPAVRRQWQESINTAPYPDSLPAYRRVRVDRLGMLWVEDYGLPGADSTKWSIFDQEGRWLSEVTIPEGWLLLDVGDDYILVLVRNELDVEQVRKHALNRR